MFDIFAGLLPPTPLAPPLLLLPLPLLLSIVLTPLALTIIIILLLLRLRRRRRTMSPASLAFEVPTLPADAELTYLAEGAANIIYRLSSPTAPSETRLLRLRKTLPSAQPNAKAYAYLSHTAFPLFPAHLLVATTLVKLPPNLTAQENAVLKQLEEGGPGGKGKGKGKRPKKRHGLYLETNEPFGFLITDMSPLPGLPRSPPPATPANASTVGTGATTEASRQILIEFKPKWVVQSPNAPPNWTRCRTCALRARKNPQNANKGFCPLDLSSSDPLRVRRAVAQLLPERRPSRFLIPPGSDWTEEKTRLEEKAVTFLLRSDLMSHLKALQTRLDPDGPLESDMGQAFMDAMTVRDLTVFLRVDMDVTAADTGIGLVGEDEKGRVDGRERGGVECGVGDLDMKTGEEGKSEYWRETERALVDEGWYKLEGEGTACRV